MSSLDLEDLPNEILYYIISFISNFRDVVSMKRVNRKFSKIVSLSVINLSSPSLIRIPFHYLNNFPRVERLTNFICEVSDENDLEVLSRTKNLKDVSLVLNMTKEPQIIGKTLDSLKNLVELEEISLGLTQCGSFIEAVRIGRTAILIPFKNEYRYPQLTSFFNLISNEKKKIVSLGSSSSIELRQFGHPYYVSDKMRTFLKEIDLGPFDPNQRTGPSLKSKLPLLMSGITDYQTLFEVLYLYILKICKYIPDTVSKNHFGKIISYSELPRLISENLIGTKSPFLESDFNNLSITFKGAPKFSYEMLELENQIVNRAKIRYKFPKI